MSVKDKIKIFQTDHSPLGTKFEVNGAAGNEKKVTESPGKLDMSRFFNFQTPKKTPRKMEMVTPVGTASAIGTETGHLLQPVSENDDENFVTPYSDRMSLTPEDLPGPLPVEEATATTICIELNHRLRFLGHPPSNISIY